MQNESANTKSPTSGLNNTGGVSLLARTASSVASDIIVMSGPVLCKLNKQHWTKRLADKH